MPRKATKAPYARGCIETEIKNGELRWGKVRVLPTGVIDDCDIAIHDLLQGKTIYLLQYGPLVTAVQRTIEMALERVKAQ